MNHYDIAAAEANLRASIARMRLPPSATEGAKCLQRNREISVQLMLLALRERNRATDPRVIVEAAAGAAAEFMFSFIMPFCEQHQSEFIEHFRDAFDTILENALTKGPKYSVAAELPSERGGHA